MELLEELNAVIKEWNYIKNNLHINKERERLEFLNQKLLEIIDFSEDNISINKEKNDLDNYINLLEKIDSEIQDIKLLLDMYDKSNKKEEEDIINIISNLKEDINKIKIRKAFSKKEDRLDCFLEINAGAGGSDSQDWVEILIRMYGLWALKQKFNFIIEDEDKGEVAGYKSARILIEGEFAYGMLKYELGTHRLVRISPFNANDKRQTSFAGIFVYPKINNNIEVKIEEKDLKIEAMKSSGAGGQHVNKTESAIRVTHIPTGIIVKSQVSRSQAQNRELAMNNLRSRLYELKLREEKRKADNLKENSTDISWGTQIRNYVMHPYQLVKDLRSNYETGNINKILDGNIDDLLKSLIFKDII